MKTRFAGRARLADLEDQIDLGRSTTMKARFAADGRTAGDVGMSEAGARP